MLNDLITGLASWGKALRLVARHGLWGYIFFPGMLSILVAILLLLGGWELAAKIGPWIQDLYPAQWWGHDIVDNAAGILAFLLTALALIFIYKYIVMIVVAAFLGPLSEKVESIVSGHSAPPFSLKNTVRDTLRALRITLRNPVRELSYTLLLLLLQLIPLVGTIASTLAIFLVQAYYAGFGNMDPVLERRHMQVSERVTFVSNNRWLSIGNGAIFVILMLIPVIGWFLAPAYGTVAATLMTLKRMEQPG
jgi:CysZ protein